MTPTEIAASRLVPTGLRGVLNKEILDSVLGQLSDGIWENSPRMETYWMFLNITMDEEGQVFIAVSPKSSWWSSYKQVWKYNAMYYKPDVYIKNFFAEKIKQILKIEFEGIKGFWKRDNHQSVCYMGDTKTITIADAYAAYDVLKERNVKKNKK